LGGDWWAEEGPFFYFVVCGCCELVVEAGGGKVEGKPLGRRCILDLVRNVLGLLSGMAGRVMVLLWQIGCENIKVVRDTKRSSCENASCLSGF
jgi:hypothetical protein